MGSEMCIRDSSMILALAAAATLGAALCATPPIPSRSVTRTLGVDFGLARIGVAVSSGFAPLPLTVLPCGGDEEEDFATAARAVARICAGEGATQVVLGMPYNSSGGEGEQAVVTREFATYLADAVAPRPVFLWDERFSSAEASIRMHGGKGAARGEVIDAVAAAVILEDFFAADDALAMKAPHVAPPRRPPADASQSSPPRPAVAPRPTPPSQSEVRRAMMEKAAREERAAASGRAGKKRGRRR